KLVGGRPGCCAIVSNGVKQFTLSPGEALDCRSVALGPIEHTTARLPGGQLNRPSIMADSVEELPEGSLGCGILTGCSRRADRLVGGASVCRCSVGGLVGWLAGAPDGAIDGCSIGEESPSIDRETVTNKTKALAEIRTLYLHRRIAIEGTIS